MGSEPIDRTYTCVPEKAWFRKGSVLKPREELIWCKDEPGYKIPEAEMPSIIKQHVWDFDKTRN